MTENPYHHGPEDESWEVELTRSKELAPELITLDHCPACGKRILDTDEEGLEDGEDGQRWCRVHRYPVVHDCDFEATCQHKPHPRPDRLFEEGQWSGYCEHLVGAGPCQYCDHPVYIAYLEDSQAEEDEHGWSTVPDYDTRIEEAQEAYWALYEEQHPPCWWIPVATMERTSR